MNLENFYSSWSLKNEKMIKNDLIGAMRKFNIIQKGLKKKKLLVLFDAMIDFGCGYGSFLNLFFENNHIKNGFGFDFSNNSIRYAKNKHEKTNLSYHELKNLNPVDSVSLMRRKIEPLKKVDVIALIDLLEHVPDCYKLIHELSIITDYFLIKLPLESSIFDNYVIKKTFPGPQHYNGHLREFTVNNVYYFVRKLGLNPIFEQVYKYNIHDAFPLQKISFDNLSPLQILKRIYRIIQRFIIKYFKFLMSKLLPTKIFLRLFGGGGYWCFASYNNDHILKP